MAEYINFEVGQKFPLPIRAKGDGGLFQVDADGMLFILQLSRTDAIAREAFRTGGMRFAFLEEDGILFLLYQIDGIFKEGWGDAPLSFAVLKESQFPTEKSLRDAVLHLYLVDTTLGILLAQRDVCLNEDCASLIRAHARKQLAEKITAADFQQKIAKIWARLSPAAMRERAQAIHEVPLEIPPHMPADANKLN